MTKKEGVGGDTKKIYRGIEVGDTRKGIEAGDYVTTDKKLAQYYAGRGGRVIEQNVPSSKLTAGETANEFFFTPDKTSLDKAQQYFKNNPTIKQYVSIIIN